MTAIITIIILLAVLVGALSLLVLIQKAQIDELTERRDKLSDTNKEEVARLINRQLRNIQV